MLSNVPKTLWRRSKKCWELNIMKWNSCHTAEENQKFLFILSLPCLLLAPAAFLIENIWIVSVTQKNYSHHGLEVIDSHFFFIGGHNKMAQVWSSNTMGVAIVLSPLWSPHEVAGIKQAHETQVVKVNGCWRKPTFESYKSGLCFWHIQTSQHVFGITDKIPAKYTILIFKILFINLHFH